MSWVVKRCPRAAETLRRAGRKEPSNEWTFSIKVFNSPTDFRGAQKGSTFQLCGGGGSSVTVSQQ
jgi:hypothetical protein